MSDVTENPPVTQPAPGLEADGHTASPTENPPVTAPDPALMSDSPVAPAEVVPAAGGAPVDAAAVNSPAVPDSRYIAAELDAVVFGITSGVNNGIERVKSLIRYVESHL